MPQLDATDLATSIVGLRRAIAKTRDTHTRASLREIEVILRRTLGPTIPKKKAAGALGISVPALDRWVDRGLLPVVAKPDSSRLELDSRAFLELAERVETHSEGGTRLRKPIAAALEHLHWSPSSAGRRVLRLDVASLPRPNVSEHALLTGVRTTTPEERVHQVAELSAMFTQHASALRSTS